MKFVCEITFFWKGETKKIFVVPEKFPLDKIDAETVAWSALLGWFEVKRIEIPEFVRNVQLDDVKEYQWDILPLTTSIDSCK